MSFYERRTTADLVDELRETSTRNDFAALVIGFDDRTEFVWASDPNPLRALNAHVLNGGDPLGVVTSHEQSEGYTSVRARPLAEYEGAEWVEKYLIQVLAAVRGSARERGIEAGPITG
jgi:hypothetical protein